MLAVTGNISFEEAVSLTEKWFGPIPRQEVPLRQLPKEPVQTGERRQVVERNVPLDSLLWLITCVTVWMPIIMHLIFYRIF